MNTEQSPHESVADILNQLADPYTMRTADNVRNLARRALLSLAQASQARTDGGARARFEAWMLTKGYEMVPRICGPGSPSEGEYANSFWQAHWDAWLAATLDSAQAVGDPVAWCELTSSGKIAYFDGKPMIMPGPVGNDCHTVPLFPPGNATQAAGAQWISVDDQRPEVNAIVLVSSTGWDKPKVLKFEARQLKDDLWERFIDNDTGRWYWYPERMSWMQCPAFPAAELKKD